MPAKTPPPKTKSPVPPRTKERIKADLAAGMSAADVRRKYNVGWSTIRLLSGRSLSDLRRDQRRKHPEIHRLAAEGVGRNEIARRLKINHTTVTRVLRSKLPAQPKPPELPPGLSLPPSYKKERPAYHIDRPGHWLVLCDVHLPYHDEATVRAAIDRAKRDNAVGVILNGDILDSHEISSHDKDPTALRYQAEIECGKQFLAWVRAQLPKADIVFKHGNHEERLDRYIMGRAPALFDLEGVNLRSLLHFREFGIDEVTDKRVIKLGRLNVVHGHEYRGGGGVNPARWLFLKARSLTMCGHFHRPQDFDDRNIENSIEAAWSVGCACELNPHYMPLNSWINGFAMVELEQGGGFGVRNLKMIGGRVR